MAKSYEQLLKQIASLQAEADRARQKETGGVVARIREAIEHYGLTADDLFGKRRPGRPASVKPADALAKKTRAAKKSIKGSKVPVKYRDREGHTWTGRGLQPVWLREAIKAGAKLEDFTV